MNRWFSLYLDAVRLLAAGFVVYAHFNVRFLYPEKLPLAEFAHSAVTVFFVLSGYVVAFVADQRENSPVKYAASRASRIYSVSILAILITPLADVIGRATMPEIYAIVPYDYPLVRIAAGLVFLAEIWDISIMMFSNLPYWSLNYEVWYYVIFGVYCFAKPSRRWVIIGLICLILGPKIVLMLPCWLAGVLAYRWRTADRMKAAFAIILWVASSLAFGAYHHYDLMRAFSEGVVLKHWGEWAHTELFYSRYFLPDWLLAAIIVVNFLATRRLVTLLPELNSKAMAWVGVVGSLTYALYIIHFPFVYMWGALLKSMTPGLEKVSVVLVLALTSVGIVAAAGEWLRPRMRKSFESVLGSQAVVSWTSRWVSKSA